MFGFNKPKRLEGTKVQMKIAQGYNNITKDFFIFITDKKSKTTCRINMSEEDYQNFHSMGRFTYRQTKKDEGEFKDESEYEDCGCSDDYEHQHEDRWNNLD